MNNCSIVQLPDADRIGYAPHIPAPTLVNPMPVVTCPECQRRQFVGASDTPGAVECVKCGHIFSSRQRSRRWWPLALVVAVVVTGAFAVGAVVADRRKPGPEPETAKASPESTPKQKPEEQTPPKKSKPVTTTPPPKDDAPKIDPDTGLPVLPQPSSTPRPANPPPDPTIGLSEPTPRQPPATKPPTTNQPSPPFASDRPTREVFTGYYLRRVHGWSLYVSKLAYEESDKLNGSPLGVIDEQLNSITEKFTEASLKILRLVPLWVEWDHTIPRSVRAYAVYYGGTGNGQSLFNEGVDPRKMNCVVVLSLKTAHRLRVADGRRQNVMLHELAHVAHDKHFGRDNAVIRNAYEQAAARRLYSRVRHDGGGVGAAYAGASEAEYFAELTCAYLDRLDYQPHDAKELREHDSVGFELMEKAWGTHEAIAAAKAKELKIARPKK